jgi:hypothetical protein
MDSISGSTGSGFALVNIKQDYFITDRLTMMQVLQQSRDDLLETFQPKSKTSYLSDMLHSYANDTCLQRYLISRDTVISSYSALTDYLLNDNLAQSQAKKDAFLSKCPDDTCLRTFRRLLYSLVGESPSDCLYVQALHYGNPEKGFQRGFSDLIASQSAKLLTMLSYSLTVYSAQIAIITKDNNESTNKAYYEIIDEYGVLMKQAAA